MWNHLDILHKKEISWGKLIATPELVVGRFVYSIYNIFFKKKKKKKKKWTEITLEKVC